MNPKLYDLIPPAKPDCVLDEALLLAEEIAPGEDFSALKRIMDDTVRLFSGKFPGYRASNTKYHDIEHTCAVFLAAARLLHGMWSEGIRINRRMILLTLAAALFHDTGLIQTEDDTEGTGAEYTIGHEQRSISFMREYFTELALDVGDAEDCAAMIECTIMSKPFADVTFRDPSLTVCGKIVGSADLLAQMADRAYLEKLLLLYEEFQEAGIREFRSAKDLLLKTEDFYNNVTLVRLHNEFDGICRYMLSHFRRRWNFDVDLYAESIVRNIDYLKNILRSERPLHEHLRRSGTSPSGPSECDGGLPDGRS